MAKDAWKLMGLPTKTHLEAYEKAFFMLHALKSLNNYLLGAQLLRKFIKDFCPFFHKLSFPRYTNVGKSFRFGMLHK